MQKHPFNEHVPDRLAGIGFATAVWAVYVSFLALYGGEEWRMAAIDGLLAVGILAVAGYQFWYVTGVLRAPRPGLSWRWRCRRSVSGVAIFSRRWFRKMRLSLSWLPYRCGC